MPSPGEPLWSLDISGLTAGFSQNLFSSVDVLDAIEERIDAINPTLNAIIAEDRVASRHAAENSAARWQVGQQLSPLDGVPVTVKDNIFVAGLPASWGSRAYAGFRPAADEPAIERLRQAGAVFIGKTNVPEFTLQGYTSNALFGTTVNPWAIGKTPGGSTGGGAAAVAAGLGPLAIGTDGGGSLRRPAGHCGVYAMKPSIGQVARSGGFRQILADFEVIGPVSRSLADLCTAFDVLRGRDARDPRSLASRLPAHAFPRRARIGCFFGIGEAPVATEIHVATELFAARLTQAGFNVEPIAAPFDLERINAVWGLIAQTGMAWEAAHLGEKAALIGDNAKAMWAQGRAHPAGAYLDALAEAAAIRRDAALLFDSYDLFLCPSIASLAWPADEAFPAEISGRVVGPRGHAIFTAWMNVAGLAALNIPVAMTEKEGGIGMQIVAAVGRDQDLLDLLSIPELSELFPPAPLAMEAAQT